MTAAARRRGDDALTAALCTACGLCCDGTLLGDVELSGRGEAARLELLGLDVDSDDADVELLALPCAALRGTRCSVYAQRPRCCRTFECRLLQETRRGAVPLDRALAQVAAARAQVHHVELLLRPLERRPAALPLAERIGDAVAAAPPATAAAGRRRAALMAASEALTGTLRATFLD